MKISSRMQGVRGEGAFDVLVKARALEERVEALTKRAHEKRLDSAKLGRIDELSTRIIAGCDALEASMVPVATTLEQMISEPAKYNAKLDMISGVIESSEGPISQPVKDVYEVVARGIDSELAAFDALLKTEVAQFDELTGRL